MKRIFKSFLSVVLTLAVLCCVAFIETPFSLNASAERIGYVSYSSNIVGPLGIVNCDERISGILIIPDKIGGYPVEYIENYAFAYCKNLTEVVIPETTLDIAGSVFKNCESLKKVTLPSKLEEISTGMFWSCSSLTEITIPESVTRIGSKAFLGCTSLTEIKIPEAVTVIEYDAFAWCSALTEIKIPNNVTRIDDGAFSYCYGLQELTIPDGVTIIACDLVSYCTNLKEITIPEGITEIKSGAFSNCDSLTDVYYYGTESQWNKIKLGYNNDPLLNANIHFLGCNHENVSLRDEVPATCTEIGYTAGSYCTDCEKWASGHKVIDALGHDEQKEVTPPTCKEQGYTTYTCTRCDYNKVDDYVDAIDHNRKIINSVDATCTEAGLSQGYECGDCGVILEAQTEIEPLGHNTRTRITQPTCTEQGYTTHTCVRCDYIEVDTYTEAKGHNYKESVIISPTCTQIGIKKYTCKSCGDSYTEEMPIAEHIFGEWVVIKEATVEDEGIKTQVCHCGATNTETIPTVDTQIGDLNGDGKITAADARLALRIAAKLDAGTPEQMTAADMNGDGKVNAADARLILRKSAKLD